MPKPISLPIRWVTSVAECDHCGDPVEDPYECEECGGVYCGEHANPLLHECPGLEEAVEESSADTTRTPTESPVADAAPDEAGDESPSADPSEGDADTDGETGAPTADAPDGAEPPDDAPEGTDTPEGPADEGGAPGESADQDDAPEGTPDGDDAPTDAPEDDVEAESGADPGPGCHYCGDPIEGDPYECPGCGEQFCRNHEKPILHNCAELEKALDESDSSSGTAAEGTTADEGGMLPGAIDRFVPRTPGRQAAVAIVLLLVVVGLATGMVGPGLLGGGTQDVEQLDTAQFQSGIYDWVNTQREDQGLDPLRVHDYNEERLQAIAADATSLDDGWRGYATNRVDSETKGCGARAELVLFRLAPENAGSSSTAVYDTSQVVSVTTDQLQQRGVEPLMNESLDTHAMGVAVGEDNVVNVVYLAC